MKYNKTILTITLFLSILVGITNAAWDVEDIVPSDQRARMRNPDGSCVQCSLAIAGIHHINKNAEMLLWNSEYGHAERGGSWPSRVDRYAKERGLEVWNITGDTIKWIEWALSTNRYAAVGFDRNHFQTAVGMSEDRQIFYVVDNNKTNVIQEVSRKQFIYRHQLSGEWCIILKGSAPPPWVGPELIKWWPSKNSIPNKIIPLKNEHLGFDLDILR